jgi:hypothetical protein
MAEGVRFHNGETFSNGYKRVVKEGREAWFAGMYEYLYDHLKYEYKGVEPKRIVRKAKEFALLLFPPVKCWRNWKASVNSPVGKQFLKNPGYFKECVQKRGGYRDRRIETRYYVEEKLKEMEYTDFKGQFDFNKDRTWIYKNMGKDWKTIKKAPNEGAITLLKELQESQKFKYDFYTKIFMPYARKPLDEEIKNGKEIEDAMIDTIDKVLFASKQLSDEEELIKTMEDDSIAPDAGDEIIDALPTDELIEEEAESSDLSEEEKALFQ